MTDAAPVLGNEAQRAEFFARVRRRLSLDVPAALRDPTVRGKLINVGFSIAESTPDQLAETMRRDHARMGELIRSAHIGE